MFKLIIQDDEGKTTVVPLIRDEITIGRKEGNTIRLTERNVSRRHARILRSNGSVLIEDLDSYNGIKVNGSRVSGRVKVAESDRIQIGDYLLELKFDRVAQAGEDIQATQPMEKVDTAILQAALPQSQQPTMQLPLPPMAAEPTAIVASGSAAPLAEEARPSRPPRPAGDATLPDVAATDVVEAQSDEPAKLVVISANMAGKEFVLDGAAMVIGRTDENDVVINHRSISRHHAKIVKEHGRYAIVDLQSSNGVRVNGEEYGKVELRRGDLIDLGHVRFRFVEPGEDFVYERDAALIKGAHRGGSRAKVYLLLGLAAAGAATAVFLLKKDASTTPAVVSIAPDARTVALSPVADAAAMIATPSPDAAPADPMSAALAEAEAAVKREDWAAAVKAAQTVINKTPRHAKYAEAVVLRDHANREMQSKKVFDELQKAANAGDFTGMERAIKRIPDGSTYEPQAKVIWDEKTRANGEKVLPSAEKLRAEGKCTELKALIRREGTRILDEQKQALDDAAGKCVSKTPVKEPKNPDENGGSATGNNNTTNTNNTNNAANAQAAYDAAMAAGRDAIVAQSYSKALQKFEEALDAKPGDQEAAMLAGISACNLKNAEVAGKYIRRLKVAAKQSMVRQLCFKQNITPKE